MNVLSLFDGISCGQIALNRIDIKYNKYFASEIKDYAIKVTQQHFPNTIQIGDVTKVSFKDGILHTENGEHNIGKIDLLLGGSPCFVKDSMVLTNKGYIPIQDVKINDLVLTHNGHYKKVLKIGNRSNVPIWNIKGMGNPGIETTEEHPFYVREKQKIWNQKKKKYERTFLSPQWVNVGNLNKNYHCGIVSTKSNNNFIEKKSKNILVHDR